MKRLIYYIALPCIMPACGDDSGVTATKKDSTTSAIQYVVLRALPHDTTSFTEGLLFYNGKLFESTGSPDNQPHLKSVVGTVDTSNGTIGVTIRLDSKKYFGEGIVF